MLPCNMTKERLADAPEWPDSALSIMVPRMTVSGGLPLLGGLRQQFAPFAPVAVVDDDFARLHVVEPAMQPDAALGDAGVDALELSTADDLVGAILRFADLRKRRRQLSAGGSLPQHLGGGHDVHLA